MSLQTLKTIASENGIGFKPNYGIEKMKALLSEAGIDVPEDLTDSHGNESQVRDFEYMDMLDMIGRELSEIDKINDEMIKNKRRKDKKEEIEKVANTVKSNKEALKEVLTFARARDLISSANNYQLNELEASFCKKKCEYVSRINSGGFKGQLLKQYPVTSYYDESRKQEMFTIYVNELKSPEDQINRIVERKILRDPSYIPNDNEMSPERTLWNRYQLVKTEFDKYFELK